ncbi:MAG: FtsW/RodA/SpoVE family cell cycle protein, partial [Bdellovibrionales bacterium]
ILIIIAIFGFVIMRGLNRLSDSDDIFSVLAAGGLLTMFGLQALVHMGSSMHLLPAKGMTLPFISYGGSSVLSMGLSMGVVLALTRRTRKMGISRGGLSLSAHLGKSTA